MKQYFLWAMAVFIPAGIVGWFLWLLGRSLVGMFQDWKLHRELDELEADYSAKRKQNQQEQADSEDRGSDAADYTARM